MKTNNFEVIFAIVNSGFEDEVMESAKKIGAKGGTVISARGTAKGDAEEFFHLGIHPEKSIIMILVDTKIKADVLKAIYESFSLTSEAQGITFSLPVTSVSDNLKKQLFIDVKQGKDNE